MTEVSTRRIILHNAIATSAVIVSLCVVSFLLIKAFRGHPEYPIVTSAPGWAGEPPVETGDLRISTHRVRVGEMAITIPSSVIFDNLDESGHPCLTYAIMTEGETGSLMCTLSRQVKFDTLKEATVYLAAARSFTTSPRASVQSVADQTYGGLRFNVDYIQAEPTGYSPYLIRICIYSFILPDNSVQRIEFSQEWKASHNAVAMDNVFKSYIIDIMSTISTSGV